MSEKPSAKPVRATLSPEASMAFRKMAERLEADGYTSKIFPSEFLSFLVVDYMEAHFEKDFSILLAEFFDSDAYFEGARKKAKGSPEFESLMAKALDEAQKIKARKRRKIVRRDAQPAPESEPNSL